jgi:hypothetical protein
MHFSNKGGICFLLFILLRYFTEVMLMFKEAQSFTDKEIMYGIMIALMRIDGHIGEYLMLNSDVEYIDEEGDKNDVSSVD